MNLKPAVWRGEAGVEGWTDRCKTEGERIKCVYCMFIETYMHIYMFI